MHENNGNVNFGNENIRSLHHHHHQNNDNVNIPKTNLSNVIKGFKIGVTKWCNENEHNFKWQKSFYDRIIRNEKELYNIRKYINQNPLKWELEKSTDNLEI